LRVILIEGKKIKKEVLYKTMKNSKKKQIPIVQGGFTWPSAEPQLMGSRCKTCNTVSFPKRSVCRNPNCKKKTNVEDILLTRRGKLTTFTLVCYPPPPPYVPSKPFVPFPIGEVLLAEGIAIIGQITGSKYEDLKIGMEVEMIVDKLFEDALGNEVVGWKFRTV
jgi:uncharacterized OB-fold protein